MDDVFLVGLMALDAKELDFLFVYIMLRILIEHLGILLLKTKCTMGTIRQCAMVQIGSLTGFTT